MSKGDSTESYHYWRERDANVLSDIEKSLGPSVIIPNGSTAASTKKGILPLSDKLTKEGSTVKILPGLSIASLISLSQLCDDHCKVFLDKKILIAVKNDEIILEGKRNAEDGLWDIPVYKKDITQSNCKTPLSHPGIYPISQVNKIPKDNAMLLTHMELAQYLHASCFSPVKSTFQKSIKKISLHLHQVSHQV